MPTTITHTVDPDGTGDYTSVGVWEAAQQRNLVTADEIARARCISSAGGADTTGVQIVGWTTDSTRYIIVTAEDDAHSGTYNTSAYRIEAAAPSTLIIIRTPFVRLQQIQAFNSGVGGVILSDLGLITGDSLLFDRCIARKTSPSANGFQLQQPGPSYLLRNCLAYDINIGFSVRGNGVTKLFNCGAHGCNIGFFTDNAAIVRNSWAQNCTTGFTAGWHATSSHNASDIGDAPGSSPQSGNIVFVNEVGDDFHLDAGDTVARNNGTDLSGDSTNPVIIDVDGEARPQESFYDIGFDEVVVAAPAPEVFTHSTQPHISRVRDAAATLKETDRADVLKVVVSNTGAPGTDGWLELRDGSAGNTLRYRGRMQSSASNVRQFDFARPLRMPNGLRVDVVGLTNWEAVVLWEG